MRARRGLRIAAALFCLSALGAPAPGSADAVTDRGICAGAITGSGGPTAPTTCSFKFNGPRLVVASAIAFPSLTSVNVTLAIRIKHTTTTGVFTHLECSVPFAARATACEKTGIPDPDDPLAVGTSLTCEVITSPVGARGAYWCSSTS